MSDHFLRDKGLHRRRHCSDPLDPAANFTGYSERHEHGDWQAEPSFWRARRWQHLLDERTLKDDLDGERLRHHQRHHRA